MGTRRDKVQTLKEHFDIVVGARDKNKCFICGLRADDVHEIISKSQFITSELEKCITPKNMVCVCRKHHAMIQGDKKASADLLRSLREMYGYDYSEQPFKWYVEEE